MTLPKPLPGLVIRYSYLWKAEQIDGRQEGQKDRPCAIVAAIQTGASGKTTALVVPVTHSAPQPGSLMIEIPRATKQRLKLDDARSWIVLSEWNEFTWPGPDLRRLPGRNDASISYGILPPDFFAKVRDAFAKAVEEQRSHGVLRSE